MHLQLGPERFDERAEGLAVAAARQVQEFLVVGRVHGGSFVRAWSSLWWTPPVRENGRSARHDRASRVAAPGGRAEPLGSRRGLR
ncbi:hypothetical protein GCM10022380_86150 [Amycolatopsis tucumanensis]|uniref:Uncharacterized protein n=1 Tax=Amycolatopsis tucumanensis TaxID=401106 RepID=A0ABP7JVQ7_9PSEU